MFFNRTVSLDNLHFRLRWVYDWHKSPDFQGTHLVQPYTVFWLVNAGRKAFDLNGERFELQTGDLVTLPPFSEKIEYACSPAEPEFHYSTIGCEAKVGAFDLIKLYSFPVVLNIATSYSPLRTAWAQLHRHFESFVSQADRKFDKNEAPPYRGSDHMQLLNPSQSVGYFQLQMSASLWLFELFKLLTPYLPQEIIPMDPRIEQVCTYISKHIAEKLTIDFLAKKVYLSEGHLRALFRGTLGLSPKEYILQTRLDRARELLFGTRLSMSDIAASIGFSNQSQFSRLFHIKIGVSPQQYRNQNLWG
jgi:AraC-like DNA-binding protein